MADYGHPLEFGVFATPVNRPPEAPVLLAQHAERLGFDLVTFQDHPYQPAFHETWTLLSWVAARTERIRLAANVHNLQLRPPAVLACAAASLDLLSGGRVELGVGAGGFPDAVRAMGGPGWSPGDAVSALEEALPIIRGIWDESATGILRREGRFHSVDGAKRGPAPAHDIRIWIGAYKPRMLRLIARAGDGWLPSEFGLGPGDYARASATIDAAAADAGRDPADIRRLLNLGIGSATADRLVELALEHGTSVFIVASDDAGELQRFVEEVAPAVRDRVAAARG